MKALSHTEQATPQGPRITTAFDCGCISAGTLTTKVDDGKPLTRPGVDCLTDVTHKSCQAHQKNSWHYEKGK